MKKKNQGTGQGVEEKSCPTEKLGQGDTGKKKEAEQEEPRIIVQDKRFWVKKDLKPTDPKELEEKVPTYLETLRTQLAQKDTKLKEVVNSLQEEQSSFKKRVQRDIDNQVDKIKIKLISNMLPAIENLERAIEAAESSHNFQSLLEGIKMVNNQFKDCLKDSGAEEIDPVNRNFDPKTDEAVQIIPVAEKEKDNTIMACLAKGYRLGDKIIKPARVAVGKAD